MSTIATADPAATPAQLAALLARWEPADAREREARARFADALERLSAPFDRRAGPVHVTASAIVVGSRGVVLHRHKRTGAWLQPGGHIDPGESPAEAAARESAEETGLDVAHPATPRLVHLDVHEVAPTGHVHLDLRYLLTAPGHDPSPPPGESPVAAWFSWEAALDIADAGLAGALHRLRDDASDWLRAGPAPRATR